MLFVGREGDLSPHNNYKRRIFIMAETKKAEKPIEEKPIVESPRMVNVFVPLARDDEEDAIFVSVNSKQYLVRKGETVAVPDFVADVIRNSEDMRFTATKYRNAHKKG